MKRFIYLTVLLVLVLGTFSGAMAQAPEKPAPDKSVMLGTATRAGVEDISGSFAAWDGGTYGDLCASGGQDYLCFNYHVQSYTWAYPYGLQMKLPAGWNGLNGYLLQYSCSGGGYPSDLAFTGGNEVNFGQTWYLSSAGDVCDAVYCMDVTTGGPEPINWFITSDGYGGGVVSTCDTGGYYSCDEAVQPPADVPSCEPGLYLSPASQDGGACEGDDVTYTVSLYNNTGVDSFFDIWYDSVFPIAGPDEIYAANATTVPFDVTVTVPCGGQEDYATVYAAGQGYQDTASLYTTVSAGGWINIPTSPVATMDHAAIEYMDKLYVMMGYGSNGAVQILDNTLTWTLGASNPNAYNDYSGDGCLGMDAAGNPVIDILGDATTFFNIERYDINGNFWTTLPYPAGYSGLWAPDIVSMVQHTGENVCYISGGATAPGGGNTNALYAYDPAAQTIANLGNFSYMPVGIAFHFSWYVPWLGTAGAICAGGGVDANSAVSGDTQCYWIAEGIFNAPNADLGPLPQPWWGGADGWKEHDGYQLWGYNGTDAAFALLQKSFKWDGSAFIYGPDPIHGVYRVEGDHFLGSVFAANGSTGGFSYSNLEEWLQQCEPCEPPDSFLWVNKTKMNTRPAGNPVGYNKVIALLRVYGGAGWPGAAIEGADAYGTWYFPDGSSEFQQAIMLTDDLGRTKFRGKWPWCGTYAFCVDTIMMDGYAYNPALNEDDPCKAIDVPCK